MCRDRHDINDVCPTGHRFTSYRYVFNSVNRCSPNTRTIKKDNKPCTSALHSDVQGYEKIDVLTDIPCYYHLQLKYPTYPTNQIPLPTKSPTNQVSPLSIKSPIPTKSILPLKSLLPLKSPSSNQIPTLFRSKSLKSHCRVK